MTPYASLVVLSYKRPTYLMRSLQSLHTVTSAGKIPYELIVADDGSQDACWTFLMQAARQRKLTTLIQNAGGNLGVGEGMFRGFAVAQGEWLCKLDADLEYSPGWLDAGVDILRHDARIGCVGFFDYRHYTPSDNRFNILDKSETAQGIQYGVVDDFVSSAMLFSRATYTQFGPIDRGSDAFAEDVMFKRKMQANGLSLAITIPDYIENFGFGLGKSEVVKPGAKGEPVVTKIHHTPLLFGLNSVE